MQNPGYSSGPEFFADETGVSMLRRIGGVLQKSDDGGVTWLPLVGGFGGYDGRRAKYGSRARMLTGLTDETLACPFWREYVTSNDFQFATIAAGTFTLNVGGPGVGRLGGNATSGGGTLSWPGFGGPNQSYSAVSMAQKRWYGVWCWKVQNITPNADSRFYGMFGTGTMAGSVAVGYNGRAQTTKYAFSAMAADVATTSPALNVVSTQGPILGKWTTGEIWYDGDRVYGSIDGEAPVQVSTANLLSNSQMIQPQFESRPAANGQTDSFDLDFDGMWVEQ